MGCRYKHTTLDGEGVETGLLFDTPVVISILLWLGKGGGRVLSGMPVVINILLWVRSGLKGYKHTSLDGEGVERL